MRFRCKTEPYRHFMGRLFANYLPTEIQDKATLMALQNHPDFERIEDEKEIEAPTEKVLIPDVCPKCGRTVKRGKFMHQKFCKGVK